LLPNVVGSNDTGYYFIESPKAVEPFKQFCRQHEIPVVPHTPTDVECNWIEPKKFSAVFDIPEFSFNSARLAARFVNYAENTGRCRCVIGRANFIDRTDANYQIHLVSGEVIEADIVINALGRWMKDLRCDKFELPLHDQSLIWERWRLLCVHCQYLDIPLLDRVLTIECANNESLAAVPHGDWVIFGCDVPRDTLSSPEDTPTQDIWRTYNEKEKTDRQVSDLLTPYFPNLEKLIREKPQHIFTFSGVYPTVVGGVSSGNKPVPYPVMKIHTSNDAPGYYLVFGGNATTSLVDASEVMHRLISDFNLPQVNESELLRTVIAPSFPSTSIGAGMIWEKSKG
jgi:hypothetical protein